MPDPPPVTAPAEAIAWHKSRLPLTQEAFQALQGKAKQQALTVAGATSVQLVADVQEALGRALAEGTGLEDFKAALGERLANDWQGTVKTPAARLETIFRTTTQSAYNAGRHAQATDPDTLALRPFWQFDAVVDGRTTSACKRANGVLLPADHPWWQRSIPPLHFNCRSSFHPLRRREAEHLGVTSEPPAVVADEGFGSPPT